MMPEMNGMDLTIKMRQLRPDIKVIFMSGYTADSISHLGVVEDGVDFIAKPLTKDRLAKKVREVLEREGKDE
jgi:two-component SAPR family response regulator